MALKVDYDLGFVVNVYQGFVDDAGAVATGHVVNLKNIHGVLLKVGLVRRQLPL
jgi:hypothetical protein